MDGKQIRHTLGVSLKCIRKSKKLNQEELAELIGKQPNSINRIETGLNFVTSDTLAELCNALNVPPETLFSKKIPTITQESLNYIKGINELLQTFSPEELKIAYNVLHALKM